MAINIGRFHVFYMSSLSPALIGVLGMQINGIGVSLFIPTILKMMDLDNHISVFLNINCLPLPPLGLLRVHSDDTGSVTIPLQEPGNCAFYSNVINFW